MGMMRLFPPRFPGATGSTLLGGSTFSTGSTGSTLLGGSTTLLGGSTVQGSSLLEQQVLQGVLRELNQKGVLLNKGTSSGTLVGSSATRLSQGASLRPAGSL